jgi:hypothetical protein
MMRTSRMITFEDFRPVTFDDKSVFDKHYEKYPPIHSDNVFTTIISWMEYADYHYAYVDGNLIIYSNIDNKIRFRPPSGKFNKSVFDQVLGLAKKQNSNYPFGVVNEITRDKMSESYPKMIFDEHRDYFDYIYLTKDLVELSGSAYAKIRNRLNKFKRNYQYSVERITEENISDVKEFLKRWCLWKDCESDPILENERKAILISINNHFELGLSGILIRINDAIESISVFEGMNKDTAIVHYEKGSPDFDGIYKAINQETAKTLKDDFMFINRESDMGISGLRKAKQSYRPHHMIKLFHVHKDNILF